MKGYLLIAEAAAKLRMPRQTVNSMARSGRLDGFKYHNQWYVSEASVEAVRKEREPNPETARTRDIIEPNPFKGARQCYQLRCRRTIYPGEGYLCRGTSGWSKRGQGILLCDECFERLKNKLYYPPEDVFASL